MPARIAAECFLAFCFTSWVLLYLSVEVEAKDGAR
jgi:hypothetical protein